MNKLLLGIVLAVVASSAHSENLMEINKTIFLDKDSIYQLKNPIRINYTAIHKPIPKPSSEKYYVVINNTVFCEDQTFYMPSSTSYIASDDSYDYSVPENKSDAREIIKNSLADYIYKEYCPQ